MTNRNFIKRLSLKYNIPQTTLIKCFDALELGMKEELKEMQNGEKLKVLDLTFETKMHSEKVRRNPKTGEKVLVAPMKKLRVVQSSDWKRLFRDA